MLLLHHVKQLQNHISSWLKIETVILVKLLVAYLKVNHTFILHDLREGKIYWILEGFTEKELRVY